MDWQPNHAGEKHKQVCNILFAPLIFHVFLLSKQVLIVPLKCFVGSLLERHHSSYFTQNYVISFIFLSVLSRRETRHGCYSPSMVLRFIIPRRHELFNLYLESVTEEMARVCVCVRVSGLETNRY